MCEIPAKPDKDGSVLLGLVRALWWLIRHLPKLGVVLAVLTWVVYVWTTGRTWRHGIKPRYVRRELRAAGNWLALVTAFGLVWQPVATAVVLALLGVGLVAGTLLPRLRRVAPTPEPVMALVADSRPDPLAAPEPAPVSPAMPAPARVAPMPTAVPPVLVSEPAVSSEPRELVRVSP